ncbi:MAG TPA: hypothetical protein VHY91_14550 [Pirellulales bacterium]|jgi:hypothetical protein|nr:hypothetical protein [Pirellulales bacterium]
MGVVSVATESISEWHAFSGTVGEIESPIYPDGSLAIRKMIVVKASKNNSGTITVKNPGAASGFLLDPGEQVTIRVNTTSKIAIVASAAGQNFSVVIN